MPEWTNGLVSKTSMALASSGVRILSPPLIKFKMDNKTEVIVGRHSKSGLSDSGKYTGLSSEGIEIAKQRAMELRDMVNEAKPGSVIFLACVTDAVRTRSTAEIYGDELKSELDDEEIVFVSREDLFDEVKMLKTMASFVAGNPEKKVIVSFPLFLKDISLKAAGWEKKSGEETLYAKALDEFGGGNDYKALLEWVRNGGEMNGLHGPKPLEVAQNYQRAVSRIEKFARPIIGERSLVIGVVGHSYEIDVYLTYLANNGVIDEQGLMQVTGGSLIAPTELASISFEKDSAKVKYRGKEFQSSIQT